MTVIERYARWLVRPGVSWAVVILTLGITVVAARLSLDVEQDDDILAFLPDSNDDVHAFRTINERFKSTDIALIGIPTADPFDAAFVAQLQATTTDLQAVQGVDSTLSLTNLPDFVQAPVSGGVVMNALVPDPPADEAQARAMRERVMSRDHVVGTLVSADADAVLIYAFATPGVQPRVLASHIREVVRRHFPTDRIYWGGGPFISSWIYDTTRGDMAALTPWSLAAIVAIMLIAYRDPLGTVLGLVATTTGIVVTLAAMQLLDVQFNIVLSAMPIILFALGSGYAIHILSHYDQQARVVGRNAEAVVRALVQIGPGLINAGFTTIVGVLSYVVMDIRPMQIFGLASAFGLTIGLVASLLFVPAFIALWPRPVRTHADPFWTEATVALARTARRHRGPVGVATAVVTVVGLALSNRVQTRMDVSAFFNEGSEPWVAQAFLEHAFGGSQFVQLEMSADFDDPEMVRELEHVGDRIRVLPHVTDVRGVAEAIELVSDAMTGARRIPDTSGQLKVLYRFLENDRAVSRMITDDHRRALLQIKLDTSDAEEMQAATQAVRDTVGSVALTGYRVVDRASEPAAVDHRTTDLITARVLALADQLRIDLGADADPRVRAALLRPPPPDARAAPQVADTVAALLGSAESFVALDPAQARAVADRVSALGPSPDTVRLAAAISTALHAAQDDPRVSDLGIVLHAPLGDAWRTARARLRSDTLLADLAAPVPATAVGARFREAVAQKLQDLERGQALVTSHVPGGPSIGWVVTGMPVLYEGLEKSVNSNQLGSVLFSLLTVYPFLAIYYRSWTAGLLPMAPMFVTLAIVFGLMGAVDMHLDIGTSILAALVVGTAVDYAVPLLDLWHAKTPDEDVETAALRAVRDNSHAVWTNALTVAAGFWVLTLGDAKPLQNVGGLTAAAMLVAAFSTFVVVPLLANRLVYRPR